MEISIFGVSLFSVAEILKMDGLCSPKFPLLTLSFVMKTCYKIRNSFWHVYGNANCFRIVDNVTRTFGGTINNHDWQPSWIWSPSWK